MSTEKMREDFEKWAETHHRRVGNWYERDGGMFELRLDGTYWVSWLESEFVAWQASRAAIEVELPRQHGVHYPRMFTDEVRASIESLGLKVKP